MVCLILVLLAQDTQTGGAGREETLKLMVNGSIDLAAAFTSKEFNEASEWFPGGIVTGNANDSNIGWIGTVQLRFHASFQDHVDLVLDLRTPRVLDDDGPAGTNYLDKTERLVARQAYVSLLNAKLGLQHPKFDIRGRGNVLFLDPANAESAFSVASGLTVTNVTGVERVRPDTFRQELSPAGLTWTQTFTALTVEVGILPDVNPAEVEGEFNLQGDEQLYFVSCLYTLDDFGSRLGAIAALMHGPAAHSRVWTLGAGASLRGIGWRGLELFAEGYGQFGKVYDDPQEPLLGGPADVNARGYCVYGGARTDLGDGWIEIALLWVSGADGDANGDGVLDAAEDETAEFLGYEGNQDLLILEDHVVGLDIDNNYWTVRAKAGFGLDTGTSLPKNLQLEVKLALARAVEDIGVGARAEDSLGIEIDIGATYLINKNASVYLRAGWLAGAEVLEMFTEAAEDTATAALLGTLVNW